VLVLATDFRICWVFPVRGVGFELVQFYLKLVGVVCVLPVVTGADF